MFYLLIGGVIVGVLVAVIYSALVIAGRADEQAGIK